MKHYILSIMEARGVSASITPAGSGGVDSTFGITGKTLPRGFVR